MSKRKNHTFGIVGGMGSMAGIDFAKRIIEFWGKEKDVQKEWDYPEFVLLSNPKLPSRTLGILNNEPDAIIAGLRDSVEKLELIGADEIYVACNTAHYFLRKSLFLRSRVVDIIKLTNEATTKNLHVLAGEGTQKARLYDKYAQCDIVTYETSPNIRHFIEMVKRNITLDHLQIASFKTLLKKDFCNIMGCTEFSIIAKKYADEFLDYDIIDPVDIVSKRISDTYV